MTQTTAGYISTHKRFWEIDLLRTVAIVMMITFHALYVTDYLEIADTMTIVRYGFWWWFPRVTAGTFIFLGGVSLTIAYSKSKRISGFLLRGLRIFGWGMVITLVTWLIPETRGKFVTFGILHFFGIAFLLGPFFLRFRYIDLIMGVALMAIGILLDQKIFVEFPWLLWLGLRPRHFYPLDYFPLLPWFGLFLVGMFCGKMLYPQGNRRFGIPEISNPVTSALTSPGRHPLVVYLAQWPIIIGVLFVLYPDKILPYVREALSYLPF